MAGGGSPRPPAPAVATARKHYQGARKASTSAVPARAPAEAPTGPLVAKADAWYENEPWAMVTPIERQRRAKSRVRAAASDVG